MNLLLRVLLVLAGLVFAASLAAVGAALFALWGARAAWARLTGRPVTPFIVRMRPFGSFGDMMARAPRPSRTPRADVLRARIGDVSDVEPKRPVR